MAETFITSSSSTMVTLVIISLLTTATANPTGKDLLPETLETSSGDIPRSDSAWIENNIIAGDEGDIVAIVTELQLQMKEQRLTYARQRSALHVLQEKVATQDTEFGKLKQAIVTLQAQQVNDSRELKILRKEVADQKWGITDLKDAQQRFRDDVLTLKREQKITNATLEVYMDLIEETYETQTARVDDFEHRIDNMSLRLQAVTDSIQQGKLNYTGLELAIDNIKKKTLDFNNHIRIIDTGEMGESKEGSGERDEWNRIASTVEENSNTIGHAMNHISKTEEMVTTEVSQIHNQMSSQSLHMSQINNIIQNLTDKISNLQRTFGSDKTSWGVAFSNVEDNILNLTEELYEIVKWRKTADMFLLENEKTILENKQDIAKTRESTIPFGGRIRYMQKLVDDIQKTLKLKQSELTNEIKSLRGDVTQTSDRLQTHVQKATSAIKSSVFKLDDLVPKVSKLSDRLAHVEVKVLNASLQECGRSNIKVVQELRVKNLELEMRFVKQSSDSHGRNIRALAGDISETSSYVHTNDLAIKRLSQVAENISTILPGFRRSQQEVAKFVAYLPQDCTQIGNQGNPASGYYLIRPMHSIQSLPVKCHMTNQNIAWTIIQRRIHGNVSFNQTWDVYRAGFGEIDGDYWIGNDNLYFLTNQAKYSLRIEMWDMQNNLWIAEFDNFRIQNEANKYMITVDGFMGNATDSLSYSNNMAFSTAEVDNDASSTNCAKFYTSGWWYKHCHYGNLNGRADIGIVWFNHDRDEWIQMKRSTMMISRWED